MTTVPRFVQRIVISIIGAVVGLVCGFLIGAMAEGLFSLLFATGTPFSATWARILGWIGFIVGGIAGFRFTNTPTVPAGSAQSTTQGKDGQNGE